MLWTHKESQLKVRNLESDLLERYRPFPTSMPNLFEKLLALASKKSFITWLQQLDLFEMEKIFLKLELGDNTAYW